MRESKAYPFIFALIICVACSVLLSAVSEGLRPQQELNAALEVKKNILKAVQLETPLPAKAKSAEVLAIYQSKIEELVVDEEGNAVEGKKPENIQEGEKLHPLYLYKEGDQVRAYCFPIVGFGLWSTLYGYFALEADAVTVRGITFYKHGETPGLGAEIEKEWFQRNFKGKTIWSKKENRLAPIAVVKGQVKDVYKDERAEHAVDGITAATMTSKGVTNMIAKWLNIYEPYFKKVRKI